MEAVWVLGLRKIGPWLSPKLHWQQQSPFCAKSFRRKKLKMDSMEKYQFVLKVQEIPTYTYLNNAEKTDHNNQQRNTLVLKPFKKYTQKIKILSSKREFEIHFFELKRVQDAGNQDPERFFQVIVQGASKMYIRSQKMKHFTPVGFTIQSTTYCCTSFEVEDRIRYFRNKPDDLIWSLDKDDGHPVESIELEVNFGHSTPTTIQNLRLEVFKPCLTVSDGKHHQICCQANEEGVSKINFHKSYLCQFSSKIRNKCHDPRSPESCRNCTFAFNYSYKTVFTFHCILYGYEGKCLTEEDLSPELKSFADEFGITFLSKFMNKMERLDLVESDTPTIWMTSIQNIRLSFFDRPMRGLNFKVSSKDLDEDGNFRILRSKEFHKSFLLQLSGYFQSGIENGYGPIDELLIEDYYFEGLEIFHKILYGKPSDDLEEAYFSPELITFANKFDIAFLKSLHGFPDLDLKDSDYKVLKFVTIVKAAMKNPNEDNKGYVWKYYFKNSEELRNSWAWQEFIESNPGWINVLV